jgi:tryptophanyl-tRNA synthetase
MGDEEDRYKEEHRLQRMIIRLQDEKVVVQKEVERFKERWENEAKYREGWRTDIQKMVSTLKALVSDEAAALYVTEDCCNECYNGCFYCVVDFEAAKVNHPKVKDMVHEKTCPIILGRELLERMK